MPNLNGKLGGEERKLNTTKSPIRDWTLFHEVDEAVPVRIAYAEWRKTQYNGPLPDSLLCYIQYTNWLIANQVMFWIEQGKPRPIPDA